MLHRDQQPAVTSTVNTRRHQPGIVPIVHVTVSYGNNRLSTYALLDSGFSVTLLAESAAKQLKPNLQGNQPLSVSGNNTVAEIQVATLQCFIGLYNSAVQPHRLDNVLSVPTLNVQTAQPNFLNSVCQQHPHLKHVTFPQLHSNNVSLLIGVDAYDVICSRGVIHGPPNTPKALNTVLGWTVVGTSSHQLPTTAETLLVQTPTLDDEHFHQVQNWMRLDNEGVSSTKKAFSANDRRAENILQSTTTKVGDRYQTDDTILAIRRFICRRGQPQSIRSDNATTFVSANKDLKAALKKLELASPEISARLGLQHIAWYFNPPAAPHFGGAWERLIRSFKDTVYKIVGSRTPHEPTLHTFACEVEAIMNNRPLLHVSSDVTDILPTNGFTVIFPILNISVVCTRVLLMPSTRKQKKARKSRGLEMLDALNLAHGQTSNDSIANMQVAKMIIKFHACCHYSNLVWTTFIAHLILSIIVLTQTNPLICVGNFL